MMKTHGQARLVEGVNYWAGQDKSTQSLVTEYWVSTDGIKTGVFLNLWTNLFLLHIFQSLLIYSFNSTAWSRGSREEQIRGTKLECQPSQKSNGSQSSPSLWSTSAMPCAPPCRLISESLKDNAHRSLFYSQERKMIIIFNFDGSFLTLKHINLHIFNLILF